MRYLRIIGATIAAASCSPAVGAGISVGMKTLEITDPARPDPVLTQYRRSWKVDLYYPAARGGEKASYAPDPRLTDAMAETGYYDIPAGTVRNWSTKPGVAVADAPLARLETRLPLIIMAPGSGMAAFNYSKLAAAFVGKGYAVAVVALPYVGMSLIGSDRLVTPDSFDGLSGEDPLKWRSAIRQWSQDLSITLDRLLGPGATVEVDPSRVVAVGHSTGGIVALQLCRSDARVVGCGDFEGAPQASDAFDGGNRKPIFVTASRSAKPDRPFVRPDLSNPFWSYLTTDNVSAWAIAITKASHMSFSDAPYEMPATLSRFGGELMSPDRSFALMTGIVDAFARSYGPDGGGDAAFADFLAKQPEVLAQRAAAK